MTAMDKITKAEMAEINRISKGTETKMAEINKCTRTKMAEIDRCAGVYPLLQSDPSPVLKYPRHLKNEPKSIQEIGRTKPSISLNCRLDADLRLKNLFQ